MPREWALQQNFDFLERLDDRIRCTHEETVAVVKLWEDIGNNQNLGCVFSEKHAFDFCACSSHWCGSWWRTWALDPTSTGHGDSWWNVPRLALGSFWSSRMPSCATWWNKSLLGLRSVVVVVFHSWPLWGSPGTCSWALTRTFCRVYLLTVGWGDCVCGCFLFHMLSYSKLTWCLMSTETTRLIRDGGGGGGLYIHIATLSPPEWLLH